MRIAAVESTTLAIIACDESRELLQLEFRNRAVYRYFSVPGRVQEGLLRAASRGRYFNAEIRGRFRYARIAKAGEA
jgi:KTSC domain